MDARQGEQTCNKKQWNRGSHDFTIPNEQITKCKDTKKRGAIAAISMKKLIHFALCKKNRCKQPDSTRIIFNFAEKTG